MADAPKRPRLPGWLRWSGGATLAAGAALAVCHWLLVGVYVVSGVSMEPTLRSGQRVVVLKAFVEPARGDLLVFRNPVAPDEVLIKRVLGLPGQELAARRGRLSIEGVAVAEPYVKPGTSTGEVEASEVFADHYYVLGDNRNESVDSRRLGPIARRLVIGKVVWWDEP